MATIPLRVVVYQDHDHHVFYAHSLEVWFVGTSGGSPQGALTDLLVQLTMAVAQGPLTGEPATKQYVDSYNQSGFTETHEVIESSGDRYEITIHTFDQE